MKFHLYGTSLSGANVDEYAVTDNSGVAVFKNILVSDDKPYTLEEVNTAIRYVVPKSQTVSITWDKVAKREFTNTLKKFTVTVEKTDAEKKKAQGDATLVGAKYGIYDGDKLIDTYTTDENGKFTTKEYVCGENWTIREIEPSEGYLLDTTVYKVGAEAKNYTVEHNAVSVGVTEQVIKGDVEIVKHCDDGQTKIETPEVGAEFQLFLKSAGRDYGVRVNTQDYAYLMRLNPYKGEYNLYCYCYKKDWLDSHLEKAERGIRFINPDYKELFRIDDGDKIRITYAESEKPKSRRRFY